MADSDESFVGPVMLPLTTVLDPGSRVIGSLGANVNLPKPVRIVVLVAVSIGAMVGALLSLVPSALVGSPMVVVGGAMFGGAVAYFVVTWSPMPGESLGKWMVLSVSKRRRRVGYHGRTRRVWVGICPMTRAAQGEIVFRSGSVPIRPGRADRRGYLPKPGEVSGSRGS